MTNVFEWPIHTSSPASDLRWRAVETLTPLLPKPHNSIAAVGRGLRKLRLDKELAEYDLLHRLHRGGPASFEQLVCAGKLLISACNGEFPAQVLPLDQELLVNPQSFDQLADRVDVRLSGANGN